MKNNGPVVKEALEFARRIHFEKEHSEQVTRLALILFDGMKQLHGLNERHRELLEVAGILHDIGRNEIDQSHNKAAMNIIIESSFINLSEIEKVMVALVVRYHRGALPKDTHHYYRDLDKKSAQIVSTLSSFLRFADGYDRTHQSLVRDIECQIERDSIMLSVKSDSYSELDYKIAQEKSDLFEKVFKMTVKIDWKH